MEDRSVRVHSATLLAIWVMWLLAGQGGESPRHEIWIAISIVGACIFAGRRFLRLIRRLRYLFLAIVLTFGLFTPGRLVIADFSLGPTFEGLQGARLALCNLAAMAGSVAILLERITAVRLTGALHRLIHPFSASHPAADSFALRLQLVMKDLEKGPPAGTWMAWLAQPSGIESVDVEPCPSFSALDLVLLSGASALLALWFLA